MRRCWPGDAPHTGARLETVKVLPDAEYGGMPPTRGHDLKHILILCMMLQKEDAPHTGARLETEKNPEQFANTPGCPPHGGTT